MGVRYCNNDQEEKIRDKQYDEGYQKQGIRQGDKQGGHEVWFEVRRNLTAAQERRAEAVSICAWHEGKKEEEEKEMIRKRKDCIVVGRT